MLNLKGATVIISFRLIKCFYKNILFIVLIYLIFLSFGPELSLTYQQNHSHANVQKTPSSNYQLAVYLNLCKNFGLDLMQERAGNNVLCLLLPQYLF